MISMVSVGWMCDSWFRYVLCMLFIETSIAFLFVLFCH